MTESIFVGAAMVATSVGITARVLGDLGVLSTTTAKIIMGAAVFDDILGMLLLAIVEGLARAGGVQWLKLGILAGEALLFALSMIFVGPPDHEAGASPCGSTFHALMPPRLSLWLSASSCRGSQPKSGWQRLSEHSLRV